MGKYLPITAAVAILAAVQLSSGGLQQDDYYHLRMAEMLRQSGLVRAFPWAPRTILAEHFADLHFGFHAWLAALPLPAKAASVLGASLVLLLVARVDPMLPLLLILSSAAFSLRLLAIRPLAISIAAFIATALLIERRRFAALLPIATALTLSHASFPLLLLPALRHWRALLAVSAGVAIGLVLHPYALWPMLRAQLFEAGRWLNDEWAAPGPWLMLRETWPLLVLLLWLAWRERARLPAYWAALTLATLALYAGYHRGIDYFVPCACVLIARLRPPRLVHAGVAAVGVLTVWQMLEAYRALEKIDDRGAATWLARNTPAGSEVFLADYGAFPQLFFLDQHNVYTVALDPAFLREQERAEWLATLRLERLPDAPYVFVENSTQTRPLYEHLLARPGQFRRRYQDDHAAIFERIP